MKYIEKYWKLIVFIFVVFIFINIALSFLLLGLLVFYFSVETYIFNEKIQKVGIERSGKIISYESDYEGYKTPIIEFETKNGELISEKPYLYASTDLSKIRTYTNYIDKPVIILHDPENPKKFVLKSEKEFNYFFIFMLFTVSLGFVIIAICSLFDFIKL